MRYVEDRDIKASRHLLCWLCATALAAAFPLLAEDPLPAPGQDAPSFSGQDQDGIPWKLSDHIGKKIVFLYFYPKDDSAGCADEACSLRDNMFELKQAGVEVVGVSFDDKDAHKNFIFKYNLDFSLLADTSGAIADAYGVRMGEQNKAASSTFLVDEIKDLPGLIKRWKAKSDPASALLWKSLSKPEQSLLKSYQPSEPSSKEAQEIVVQALNKAIGGPCISKDKKLKGVSVRPETIDLMKQNPKGRNLALLNRLLLEDAYPEELSRNQRMDRRVSFLIGLDGKIIHVTDLPDPAAHVKALAAALAKMKGNAAP
jgi:thioredoxin-dependent peroxiredoxin